MRIFSLMFFLCLYIFFLNSRLFCASSSGVIPSFSLRTLVTPQALIDVEDSSGNLVAQVKQSPNKATQVTLLTQVITSEAKKPPIPDIFNSQDLAASLL